MSKIILEIRAGTGGPRYHSRLAAAGYGANCKENISSQCHE
jgi:hypothetical protein